MTPAPNKTRARREASKNLGIAMQYRLKNLKDAQGDEAIAAASIELGVLFNDNVEFIVWVLKEYGGVEQMPFQPGTQRPANEIVDEELPTTPSILTA